jgi:hypothetical protein
MFAHVRKWALAAVSAVLVAGGASAQEPINADVLKALNELRAEMAEMKAKNAKLEMELSGMKHNGGLVPVVYGTDKDGKPVAVKPVEGQPNWCPPSQPSKGHGCYAFADWLRWRAREHTTAFSGTITPITGTGIDTDSLAISAVSSEFKWDNGLRLGIGWRSGDGWDINLQGTWYETSGSAALGDPTLDTDTIYAALVDSALSDAALLNGDFDDFQVDAAAQQKSLRYRVYDLNFGKAFDTCGLVILPSIGFRYADLRNVEQTVYTNLEPPVIGGTDVYAIERRVDMKAYGLRSGVSGSYCICPNVSLHADSAISLLYADFDSFRGDAAFNESLADTEIRTYDANIKTVVPVLELRLGASYTHKCLTVALGWEFQHWFNMRQHPDSLNTDDTNNEAALYRLETTDLSIYGWFLRAGVTY